MNEDGFHPSSFILHPSGIWEKIATEAKLSGLKRILLEPQVEALRTYTGLRETAKIGSPGRL